MHTALLNRALTPVVGTFVVQKGCPIGRLLDGTYKIAVAPTSTISSSPWCAIASSGGTNKIFGGAQASYVSTAYPDTKMSQALNYIANPDFEAVTDRISGFDTLGSAAAAPAVGDKVYPAFVDDTTTTKIPGWATKLGGGDTLSVARGEVVAVRLNLAIANNPTNTTTQIQILFYGTSGS
jgi:hypothetical protein